MYFCDTLYEGVGKTPILGDRGGRGVVLILSQNCVTSFMTVPLCTQPIDKPSLCCQCNASF